LYFFSGARDDFRTVDDDAAVGRTDTLATGMLTFWGEGGRGVVEVVEGSRGFSSSQIDG
jgi:hypothetical protein